MPGVTVVALGKLSALSKVSVFKMDVFSILFLFFGVAASTVNFGEALSKVDERRRIDMAIGTRHAALLVDIERPFVRIHEQRAQKTIRLDLMDV